MTIAALNMPENPVFAVRGLRSFITDRKINTKITAGFALVLFILAGVSIMAYHAFGKVDSISDAYARRAQFLRAVSNVDSKFSSLHRLAREFLATGQEAEAKAADEARTSLRQAISKALEDSKAIGHEDPVRTIEQSFNGYSLILDKVMAQRIEGEKLNREIIDPVGLELRKRFDSLQKNAAAVGKMDFHMLASAGLHDLMRVRLAINKMIDIQDFTFRERMNQTLTDLRNDMEALDAAAPGTEFAGAFGEIKSLYQRYLDAAMRALEISGILAGRLSEFKTIGAGVTADIKAIVESASAEEQNLHRQAGVLIEDSKRHIFILAFGGIILGFALSWFIGRGIARPVVEIADTMRNLAQGGRDVAIPYLGRGDEIGGMAEALAVFKDNLKETERLRQEQEEQKRTAEARRKAEMAELAERFEQAVGSIIESVASTSAQLRNAAEVMTEGARETANQTAAVASASATASANVQSVAAATEQLSYSIREIRDQVHRSHKIASDAAAEADKTNARVRELAEAAERIGGIVDVISQIAAQTNMLALNATIEAARAGEAGRGFAVVAQEVKALAEQTAKATTEIGQQITGIQDSTQNAATFIASIAKTTQEVSAIASAIASAVEEQGSATQEIARNVQEASAGTKDVVTNIDQVTKTSESSGAAASQVLSAATDLFQQSGTLKQEVQAFLRSVRAA